MLVRASFAIVAHMIASLSGTVSFSTEKYLTIEAGGIGYKVAVTTSTALKTSVGKNILVHTHLAIREDAHELYGFLTRNELEFFEKLLLVSGIGPKSALNILNIAPVETLTKAIASGDVSYLTKVSGIGKKTAEKIVFELKEKLSGGANVTNTGLGEEADALLALTSLGYSHSEARGALREIPKTATQTSARVKEALKILGKH